MWEIDFKQPMSFLTYDQYMQTKPWKDLCNRIETPRQCENCRKEKVIGIYPKTKSEMKLYYNELIEHNVMQGDLAYGSLWGCELIYYLKNKHIQARGISYATQLLIHDVHYFCENCYDEFRQQYKDEIEKMLGGMDEKEDIFIRRTYENSVKCGLIKNPTDVIKSVDSEYVSYLKKYQEQKNNRLQGNESYYARRHWVFTKRRIRYELKKYGLYYCKECGIGKKQHYKLEYELHHYDEANNNAYLYLGRECIDDLGLLCKECHKEHSG